MEVDEETQVESKEGDSPKMGESIDKGKMKKEGKERKDSIQRQKNEGTVNRTSQGGGRSTREVEEKERVLTFNISRIPEQRA